MFYLSALTLKAKTDLKQEIAKVERQLQQYKPGCIISPHLFGME
jgi:hypothetical protein